MKKAYKEGGLIGGEDWREQHPREERGEVIVPNESAKINARWEKLIEIQKALNNLCPTE